MSINVNFGDGWTYYTDKERKQMADQKKIDSVLAKAMHMSRACIEMSCVPIPVVLADVILQAVACTDFPSDLRQDIETLVNDFREMIEESRKRSASYPNN